jgi:thiol-disulfide isomerase/thioredoxin
MNQLPPTANQSHFTTSGLPKKRLAVIVAGCVTGAVVGLAGIYGIGRLTRNAALDPACRPAQETAVKLGQFARGEVAGFAPTASPRRWLDLSFKDAAGQTKTLADWQGRTVLLNLWATWCIPCRKEMHSLDALQQKLDSPNFEVVAVNTDTRDPEKPKAWFKDVGIARLAYYADPSNKIFQNLKVAGKAHGLPTTLLLDGAGCELAAIEGPAEWASADAVDMISAALPR